MEFLHVGILNALFLGGPCQRGRTARMILEVVLGRGEVNNVLATRAEVPIIAGGGR
jgi:hypothetical protein